MSCLSSAPVGVLPSWLRKGTGQEDVTGILAPPVRQGKPRSCPLLSCEVAFPELLVATDWMSVDLQDHIATLHADIIRKRKSGFTSVTSTPLPPVIPSWSACSWVKGAHRDSQLGPGWLPPLKWNSSASSVRSPKSLARSQQYINSLGLPLRMTVSAILLPGLVAEIMLTTRRAFHRFAIHGSDCIFGLQAGLLRRGCWDAHGDGHAFPVSALHRRVGLGIEFNTNRAAGDAMIGVLGELFIDINERCWKAWQIPHLDNRTTG